MPELRSNVRARRVVATIAAAAVVAVTAVGGGPPAAAQEDPAPQEPFLCTTDGNGLGQPIVDNQDGLGTPEIGRAHV